LNNINHYSIYTYSNNNNNTTTTNTNTIKQQHKEPNNAKVHTESTYWVYPFKPNLSFYSSLCVKYTVYLISLQ